MGQYNPALSLAFGSRYVHSVSVSLFPFHPEYGFKEVFHIEHLSSILVSMYSNTLKEKRSFLDVYRAFASIVLDSENL